MKLRETRNHPRLTIFLCFLLLVAMVAIIFAIVDYLRDEQPVVEQPSAQPGPIIAQETAGAEVDRAVGAAVEQYQTVLDAEWIDPGCWLSHCPNSSWAIRGTPPERALLTKAERGNLEARDDALQRFQRIAVVSTIYVYSVKASPGKGVEAIVSVMTNKGYDNNRISSTDIHRMFLAASSVNAKEYVVLADEVISPETGRLTESYVPLYSSRRDKPPCFVQK